MKRNCVVAGIVAIMLVTATGCGNGKETDMNIETEVVTILVDENTMKDEP